MGMTGGCGSSDSLVIVAWGKNSIMVTIGSDVFL